MKRQSPLSRGHDATTHLDPEGIEMLALLRLNGDGGNDAPEGFLPDEAHVAACDACRLALEARMEALGEERAAIETLIDAQLGDEALETQRRSILDRLAGRRDVRVLDFPVRPARAARRDRPAVRWLAAAAAAGLFVGMLAGQRLQPMFSSPLFGPGHETSARLVGRTPAWREPGEATADPRPVHAHDELFLSEMETAVNNRGALQLRALDDLTPTAVTAGVRSPR